MNHQKVSAVVVFVVMLGGIIGALSITPSTTFINGHFSFLYVRALVAVFALFGALGSYGVMPDQLTALKDEVKAEISDMKKATGFVGIVRASNILGWSLWWILCFEIMASFWVADWLKYGF